VRYFYNGQAVWVTQTDNFTTEGMVFWGSIYAHNVWAAVLEKSWLQFCYEYKPTLWNEQTLTTSYSYSTLRSGGFSDYALSYLTGDNSVEQVVAGHSSRSDWCGSVFNKLAADFSQGAAITFGSNSFATGSYGLPTLVSGHEFFVLGFDPVNKEVELGNPWGDRNSLDYNAIFWISMSELHGNSWNYFTVADSYGASVQSSFGKLTSAMATNTADFPGAITATVPVQPLLQPTVQWIQP
jgi:hypothetical protein